MKEKQLIIEGDMQVRGGTIIMDHAVNEHNLILLKNFY